MFKKGLKALKTFGKKSKKKEKGDGDNVSQSPSEAAGGTDQGTPQKGKKKVQKGQSSSKGALAGHGDAVAHSLDSESIEDEGASAYPRPSLGSKNASPSSSGHQLAGVKSAAAVPQPNSREREAEESVLAMMMKMKESKDVGKPKEIPPELTQPEHESTDDDSLSSDSSDSELTYKKQGRNRKSDGSSWGDTSDILPGESEQKQTPTKLESAAGASAAGASSAATKKPAAAAAVRVKEPASESDSDDWGDTDDEVDDEKPQQSVVVKQPVAPDQLSDAGSKWSDTEDEQDTRNSQKSPRASFPTAAPASADKLASSNSSAQLQKRSEEQVKSESESAWSEDDLQSTGRDAMKDSLTSQFAVETVAAAVTEATQSADNSHLEPVGSNDRQTPTISRQQSKDKTPTISRQQSKDITPAMSRQQSEDKTAAVSRQQSKDKAPVISRQQSEDSPWSDEDDSDIESAAAPPAITGHSNSVVDEITKQVAPTVKSEPLTQSSSVNKTLEAGVADGKGDSGDVSSSVYGSVRIEEAVFGDRSVEDNQNKRKTLDVNASDHTELAAAKMRETSLIDENSKLKQELSAIHTEKEKLDVTVQNLETRSKELENLNQQLLGEESTTVKKSMYDDVTQKLKVIMDENQRLVQEHSEIKDSSSQKITELSKKIEHLEKARDVAATDQWDKGKAELQRMIESWKTKYLDLEVTSAQQQSEYQTLETEVKDLIGKLELSNSKNAELQTDKNNTIRELDTLRQELKDKDGSEIMKMEMERAARDSAEKIRKISAESEEQTRAHDRELQRVQETHDQQIDQLNEATERAAARADKKVESLNTEVNLLQSENKGLQDKYSKLRTEQSERNKRVVVQSEYDEQQTENELLRKKIKELEKKLQLKNLDGIEPSQAPIVKNTHISSSSSDDDDDLRHQTFNGNTSMTVKNVQQKELERREEKIKQLKSENTGLQKTLSNLESEKRSAVTQLQDKEEDAANLRVQNEKLEEKLNIRDQEVTMELKKKLESELTADAERGKLGQQIILLESTVSRLQGTNTQLEQRLNSLTAELGAKENLLRSQSDGQGPSADFSALDSELIQVRTELAQLRSNSDAERATFMAAIDEKDREVIAEASDKESAKAALDEVTKSLMYMQEDINANYVSISAHQDMVQKANEQEDRVHKELVAVRNKLDTYSKETIEAKNVCSMQVILINEKDRELRDKEKELRGLRRELDSKMEALSTANVQLQQSAKDRDRDHDRLRDEMMSMSRHHDPHSHMDSTNYKTLYDELKVDKERDKATTDQLIERLKREISTVEERLRKAKDELQDKVKLETNFLLAQGEAERYKQEAVELVRKVSKLEEKVEQYQRDSDYLKDSRHEVGASNQTLKDENSRLREINTQLRAQFENAQRELSGYNVTKEEMEAALATAKLTTDVNDMSREETHTEIQLERKHKMILYKQAKSLRAEVTEKNGKLQELQKITEKLKTKVTKLKTENNGLYARLKERTSADSQLSWDIHTGLTQADMFQQEVKQLQTQLASTTTGMQSQARKAKSRKYDLNYYQTKAEDLEKQNQQLNSKLNDSLRMIQTAERTATDLRNHITELNNRLLQYERLESSADMSLQELRLSQDDKSRSVRKENNELDRELRQLKAKLAMAEVELASADKMRSFNASNKGSARSRSTSPILHRSKTSSGRYGGSPTTDYERDRRALTRAAWAVLDDHGLGPPAEQRVFENLDRIWRRNASRPSRRM